MSPLQDLDGGWICRPRLDRGQQLDRRRPRETPGRVQIAGQLPRGTTTGAIVVADINGDGLFDLNRCRSYPREMVLASACCSEMAMGTFQNPVGLRRSPSARCTNGRFGDFTGDGKSDLVVGSSGSEGMGGMGDGSGGPLRRDRRRDLLRGPYEVMDYSSYRHDYFAVALGDLKNDDGRPRRSGFPRSRSVRFESGCHKERPGSMCCLTRTVVMSGRRFEPRCPLATRSCSPISMGDGNLSIVTAGGQQGVLVARGNGEWHVAAGLMHPDSSLASLAQQDPGRHTGTASSTSSCTTPNSLAAT